MYVVVYANGVIQKFMRNEDWVFKSNHPLIISSPCGNLL